MRRRPAKQFVVWKQNKVVSIEGQGQYKFEITQLINKKTMDISPLLPSLMNAENVETAK